MTFASHLLGLSLLLSPVSPLASAQGTLGQDALTPVSAAVEPLPEAALAAVPVQRVVRPGVVVPGTPPELNASITLRYGPARPRAVILLMPGYVGGAGSLDRLARQIVALDPALAVWTVDRRSNLLEPQEQLAQASPAELARIVQQGLPPRAPDSVPYLRDWGLVTTLEDWRAAVLEARTLTSNVFLGGHSMGGTLTGLYAAYDFGGQRGYRDAQGLILLDGLPGTTSAQPLTREQYEQGGLGVLGPISGLKDLSWNPYVVAPFFNPLLASRGAAQARLAAEQPEALAPAGGLSPFPATNLASALLQLEQRYALLPFMTVKTGRAANAAEAPNVLGLALGAKNSVWVFGPARAGEPVGWQQDPQAPTDALDLVRRFWTPLADYTEWYFPNRLMLDLAAARTSTLGTPFQADLRVWHTPDINLPVLGIAAGEGITQENQYQRYLAQTKGSLTFHTLKGAAHLDIVSAQSDQVARWILEWLRPKLK